MFLMYVAQHALVAQMLHVSLAHLAHLVQVYIPIDGPDPTQEQAYKNLVNFANGVTSLIRFIAATIFFIGITIAGMLRMMAFGSDRRILLSNMALTSGLVGAIVIAMATVLQMFITNILGFMPH